MRTLKMMVLAAMAICLGRGAFAAWPYGNIGLGVDHAMAQLDVLGTNLVRGRMIILDNYNATYDHVEEELGYLQEWIDGLEMPVCQCLLFYSDPNCAGCGMGLADDGSVFAIFGETTFVGSDKIRFHKDDKEVVIGKSIFAFDDCTGTNVTHSVESETDDCLVQLSNSEYDDVACTLELTRFLGDYQGRVTICSYNMGNTAELIVNVDGGAWFTVSADDDMCIELMWLPPHGGDNGRWQYLSGCNAYDGEALEPVFHNGDGRRFIKR